MAIDLKSELETLSSDLTEFHDKRKLWDSEVRRELETELPPETTNTEPVDYQSADLEKAIFDHVEVLRMNPTRFDANCLDQSPDAKKAERNVLLTMARTWAGMNGERWWDAAVGEGQVRHGVKVMWLRWKEPGKASVIKGEGAGERWRRWPFYWSNTNLFGDFWKERDGDADVFYYRYVIPVLGSDIRKTEGGVNKKITLDTAGKIGWLGLDEEPESSAADKKIEVIVRDARKLSGEPCPLENCDHPLREITVSVCPDGEWEHSEEVESYDSPFPGCSFMVIGARTSHHETNFHQKYRPLMLPMYQEQFHQNYLKTLLATEVREAYGDQNVYVDGSTIPPHISAQIGEGGQLASIDRSTIDSNEIPVFPGQLRRWPKEIDPHLQTLIADSQKKMSDYVPNRFVIGTAFTEASNATGTAFLQQAQQAALPYNGLLGQSDGAIKKAYEYMFHAIRVFGREDKGFVTKYMSALTGAEVTRKHAGKPGENVWVDAGMLEEYDFDILLKTESQTVAEEGARWLQAKDKYLSGVFTVEQLFEAAGIFDVELQKRLMYAQNIREFLHSTEMAMAQGLALTRASAYTGADFTQFAQQSSMQGGQPGTDAGTVAGVPSNDNMGRAAEQVALTAASVAGGAQGGSNPTR